VRRVADALTPFHLAGEDFGEAPAPIRRDQHAATLSLGQLVNRPQEALHLSHVALLVILGKGRHGLQDEVVVFS
jgi:hypothetical protein